MVVSYLVVVFTNLVVVQVIATPSEVALGGVCEFAAPLC